MKALTFAIGEHFFGLPIEPVREIIGLAEITPVPMMPGYLRGVMNLRGSVVPVVDLAARLGLGTACISERSCILLVECAGEDGRHLVGVMVDAVHDVLSVDSESVAAPPNFGTLVEARFLSGLLQRGQGSLMLLATERVLSLAELEDEVDALERVAA
jgi:purine-binding chemotaxis protein CheW